MLIVGIDTVAGRAVARRLAENATVTGLWTETPEFFDYCQSDSVSAAAIAEAAENSTCIIFCGGASRSSWDARFGTFKTERRWLSACVDAAKATGSKLVYISSDAVFGGPWIFHDDESAQYAEDEKAATLLDFERRVADVKDSLVVRANVLGLQNDGCLGKTITALMTGAKLTANAHIYSTPIAAPDFATSLCECVAAGTSGHINIGGSERTTPFRLATLLASQLNSTSNVVPQRSSGASIERSLRCNRLRKEILVSVPVLKETIDAVVDLQVEECDRIAAA